MVLISEETACLDCQADMHEKQATLNDSMQNDLQDMHESIATLANSFKSIGQAFINVQEQNHLSKCLARLLQAKTLTVLKAQPQNDAHTLCSTENKRVYIAQ